MVLICKNSEEQIVEMAAAKPKERQFQVKNVEIVFGIRHMCI